MAKNQTDFGISFRALLSDATEALGWPQPMYYQASFERNEANLVLARGKRPNACLFRGDSWTLVESKEHAAEQAVDFLVQKKQIVVEDANLSRKEMYKACCHFYKEKRKALENVGQALLGCERSASKTLKVAVPSSLPKKVTADLWSIWLQVVAAYDVDVDEVDFITQPGGRHVCCFTISWSKPSPRERYFIGDCSDTLEKAKQNLVVKAINYFQTIFGFSVKDANFNRMLYSKIHCGFQRTRYLAAKEKHVCVAADLESVPMFVADGYNTPEGPLYGIQSGHVLPPPPKRHL